MPEGRFPIFEGTEPTSAVATPG